MPDLASLRSRLRNPAGRHDQDSATLWTSPWSWRDEDGVYVGHSGEAWLYRKVPTNPIVWEDPAVRLARGLPLDLLLREIGALSTDPTLGLAMLADEREIHILSVTWEEMGAPPAEITPELTEFQAECLDFLLPRKILALGVKLKSGLVTNTKRSGLLGQLRGAGERILGESVPDREQWAKDYERINTIFHRHGATNLDRNERAQIESWFNNGQGPDVLIKVTKDSIIVDDDDRIELAVVRAFNNQIMEAPNSQWVLDAVSHQAGPSAISVRGQLQTANAARSRARSGLRRRKSQMEEERLTGDLERVEDTQTYAQAQQIEAFIALNQEPIVTNCSIIMAARRNIEVNETYIDELRNLHGIDISPLVMRQLESLDECLPTSTRRVNPFLQDVTISMLAYCGLQGWSNLGDDKGVFMGLTNPDYTPCYLDLLGAPAANKPPAFAIFGDPGGGKAQPLDSTILTPSGWTTMGALHAGDQVVAVDGTATRVVAVYHQGIRPIYRLTFHDGASVEADAEHLWMVAKSRELSWGIGFKTMNTLELLETGLRDADGKRRWRIPVVAPVQLPSADLPLDPYLLGLLLGDGMMTSRIAFSTLDHQLLDSLAALVPAGVQVTAVPSHRSDYTLTTPGGQGSPNPLRDALRGLGLFSKTSLEKSLPRTYLQASIAQRTALLQGLMDTDGEPTRRGAAHFYTSSPQLAVDVTELVESLGGTSRMRSKIPTYTHLGAKRTGHQAFTLSVRLPAEIIPFRLARKLQLWESVKRPAPVRILDSIEYVGDKPAQCILVEHPEHLYITDRHIVTHNTFLCQAIAAQATLAGQQVIFINPKQGDSLAAFTRLPGVNGTVVKLTQLEKEGGYFDPFYYADPERAAQIATSFILGVMGSTGVAEAGFTQAQELRLASGLRRGATAGAQCVAEALRYVDDPEIVKQINEQIEASSLFALGVGRVAKKRYQSSAGLTLIEFDRKLDFPERGKQSHTYQRDERLALAVTRLVIRASLEILMNSRGGVLIVDEAWTFLSHSEGLAALQLIGREGRSLNILPIFATQRVNDLIREGVDMESYISRVMVMELRDERDATAALTLCGLEPTPERIRWLRQAGPKAGNSVLPFRPAMGLHRDLEDRHAAIYVGPFPAHVVEAFTTNPEERRQREERYDSANASLRPADSAPAPVDPGSSFAEALTTPVVTPAPVHPDLPAPAVDITTPAPVHLDLPAPAADVATPPPTPYVPDPNAPTFGAPSEPAPEVTVETTSPSLDDVFGT